MKYEMEIKPQNSKSLVTQKDELFEAFKILGKQLEMCYNKTAFLKHVSL